MSKLVPMTKNGETIGVHETLVGAHENVGWTVGGELPVVKAATPKTDDGQLVTAAEVLAMADGNFMAFKSAAKKILGDETPAKKDEIVAALQAKAAA